MHLWNGLQSISVLMALLGASTYLSKVPFIHRLVALTKQANSHILPIIPGLLHPFRRLMHRQLDLCVFSQSIWRVADPSRIYHLLHSLFLLCEPFLIDLHLLQILLKHKLVLLHEFRSLFWFLIELWLVNPWLLYLLLAIVCNLHLLFWSVHLHLQTIVALKLILLLSHSTYPLVLLDLRVLHGRRKVLLSLCRVQAALAPRGLKVNFDIPKMLLPLGSTSILDMLRFH